MKITNDSLPKAQLLETTAGPAARLFAGLEAGARFRGTILDIYTNQLTIRLENGQTLTAKANLPPNAHIGDESIFTVKEMVKGQVLLEMLPAGGARQTQALAALEAAGLPKTPENMELVKMLLENHLPLDPAALQKAAFFRYAQPQTPMEHVLFLLTENFPAAMKPITTLAALADGTMRLETDLAGLTGTILAEPAENQLPLLLPLLTEENLREINRSLTGKQDAPAAPLREILRTIPYLPEPEQMEIRQKIVAELQKIILLDLTPAAEGARKEPEEYYRDIMTFIKHLEKTAALLPLKTDLTENIRQIKDNLEFTAHIQQYREYMQIPFLVHGQANQGELYIFKKKQNQRDFNREATVLIALDLAVLGHLEAIVNKRGKKLSLHIRGDREDAVKQIARQSGGLRDALARAGYTVSGLSVTKMKEAFRFTQPVLLERNDGEDRKRYSLDVRV